MKHLDLEALIYQLEKVDSGGEVQELFEDRLHYVAKQFDLEIEEDDESPYIGAIKLPDGGHADLTFSVYIVDKDGKEVKLDE